MVGLAFLLARQSLLDCTTLLISSIETAAVDPGGSRHAGELRRPARSEAHEGIGARLGCKTASSARCQNSKLGKEQARQGASSARPKARARARRQAQGARRGKQGPGGAGQGQGSRCGPRHAQVGPWDKTVQQQGASRRAKIWSKISLPYFRFL